MGKDGPGTSLEMDRTLQNGNDHLGCKQSYFKLENVKNQVQIDKGKW